MADLSEELNSLADEVEDFLGPHERALVENIGANLGISVRPSRNDLHDFLETRSTYPEIVEAARLELTPQQEQNLRFSMEAHLRSAQRAVADRIGQELDARTFVMTPGSSAPDKQAVVLKLDEYADGNYPSLGKHPRDLRMPIPVPKGMKGVAEDAARIFSLSKDKRKDALAEVLASLKAKAQK